MTGGAGYVGSHTVVALQERGHDVAILDNFSNSRACVAERIGRITGVMPVVYAGDVRDAFFVSACLREFSAEAVLHFAALKSVNESIERPIDYYDVNVGGTLSVLRAMMSCGVTKFVFSSSATVYAPTSAMPVSELACTGPVNPYGRSKLMGEDLIRDACLSEDKFTAVALRYFNPVGAHSSALIGEDSTARPNNIMPRILDAALGRGPGLEVFGLDWPTKDGAGVRDYVHVVDVATAHVRALEYLEDAAGIEIFNIGTGRGTSVLELLQAFESVSGVKVGFSAASRRPGDLAEVWADPTKAEKLLNWRAELGIVDMCRDAWAWVSRASLGL